MSGNKIFMGAGEDMDWDNLKLDIAFDNVKSYYMDHSCNNNSLPSIKIVYTNGKIEVRHLEIVDKQTLRPGGIVRIIFHGSALSLVLVRKEISEKED